MNPVVPPLWTIAALVVSAVALLLAFLNFRRKSSLNLRASYRWTSSSIDADDQHISSLVIENLKDRAVTIYGIYLRVGHSFYIEIDDFEQKPLILRAFESWHKEYGPIESYDSGMRRVAMNGLFDDKRAKRRIVLSTGDGKYVVKRSPNHWKPTYEFFKNYMTGIVTPIRGTYRGTAIGGTVPYVVDVVRSDGESEVIAIHRRDHNVQRFKSFRLTEQSLETADSLRKYLQSQLEIGNLVCKSFEVIDVEALRARERPPSGKTIVAKYTNYLRYKVLGRIYTLIENRRIARRNRAAVSARNLRK